MHYLATLFWFIVFVALWTPLSVVFRASGAGRFARSARDESLWTPRKTRSFREMRRQG